MALLTHDVRVRVHEKACKGTKKNTHVQEKRQKVICFLADVAQMLRMAKYVDF